MPWEENLRENLRENTIRKMQTKDAIQTYQR